MTMKNLAIAEDHRILRDGLKSLLTSTHLFEVVCEAENGVEAIRCVKTHTPDLLLLDLSMPILGGMSVIKEIKDRHPNTKILVLTMHESEEYLFEALRLGADGYCTKDSGRKELLKAIEKVLEGGKYVSPGIAEKVLDGYLKNKQAIKPRYLDPISRREKEILKLVGEGYHNKQIAEILFISPKTVEKHRSNIMNKLNIHTVAGLTAYAIERGLVSQHAKN